ncbi:hypothetical protein B0H16DRAFT_1715664 [Mycena metata]|uniref:Uncharacterized protein n=1 Tax=Mycena metata TaxID=1033252 RepID=A0AAD7JTM5_9AGAR|nr:hypothetical protein B0H16DRAFT_1715664 [Mycena metata]
MPLLVATVTADRCPGTSGAAHYFEFTKAACANRGCGRAETKRPQSLSSAGRRTQVPRLPFPVLGQVLDLVLERKVAVLARAEEVCTGQEQELGGVCRVLHSDRRNLAAQERGIIRGQTDAPALRVVLPLSFSSSESSGDDPGVPHLKPAQVRATCDTAVGGDAKDVPEAGGEKGFDIRISAFASTDENSDAQEHEQGARMTPIPTASPPSAAPRRPATALPSPDSRDHLSGNADVDAVDSKATYGHGRIFVVCACRVRQPLRGEDENDMRVRDLLSQLGRELDSSASYVENTGCSNSGFTHRILLLDFEFNHFDHCDCAELEAALHFPSMQLRLPSSSVASARSKFRVDSPSTPGVAINGLPP